METSTFDKVEAEAQSRFRRMRAEASHRFKAQPLLCTAMAAGAGFLLGGGLATKTTLRVLRNSASLILQLTVVPYILNRLRDTLAESTE